MSDGPFPMTETAHPLAVARDALIRLAAMALPAEAHAIVAEAQAALRSLDPSSAGDGIDRDTFEGLLKMAGPEVAPELLSQMLKDLRAVQVGLGLAAEGPDFAQIRAQTHVLSALAGAAGATTLESAARDMNMAAHGVDAARVAQLLLRVQPGLAALIGFVETAAATWAAAPR